MGKDDLASKLIERIEEILRRDPNDTVEYNTTSTEYQDLKSSLVDRYDVKGMVDISNPFNVKAYTLHIRRKQNA